MAMPSRKAEARPDRESHEHPYGANRGVLCEIAIADHFQEILPDIGRRGRICSGSQPCAEAIAQITRTVSGTMVAIVSVRILSSAMAKTEPR